MLTSKGIFSQYFSLLVYTRVESETLDRSKLEISKGFHLQKIQVLGLQNQKDVEFTCGSQERALSERTYCTL